MTWLEFDSLVNARDVGGTPTVDGATIAAGRLIRTDHLQSLTPADITRLRDLQVSDVIDLRSAFEVHSEGPGPLNGAPGIIFHHYSYLRENHGELSEPDTDTDTDTELPGKALPWVGRRPQTVEVNEGDDAFAAHYLSYVVDRPESVLSALRAISWARGAALVHCAAGKDRTGTTVAFSLLLAGAEPEAVIADYAASSERMERIVDKLLASQTYHDALKDRPMSTHLTRPESMRALLERIDRDYGGLEALLAQIGWNDEDTQRMRDRLRA